MTRQQIEDTAATETLPTSSSPSFGAVKAESAIRLIREGSLVEGVDSLQDIGASETDAIPVLLSAITDIKNGNLRSHICSTLGNMRVSDSAVVQALRDRLSDPESYVRQNAAIAISNIGQVDHETATTLIAALAVEQEKIGAEDTIEFDRNHMLKALAHGIDAHPGALSTIQSFGDDPSQYVLETVRDILSKHGIPTDEFEQKIADAKAVAKAAGKKQLAERDARTFLERLRAGKIAEARDDTWHFKEDHADAVPVLLEAARDSVGNTRSAIASLLGEMKQDAISAIPTLRELLSDPKSYVRQNAAIAISNIGQVDHETATALIAALAVEQEKIGAEDTIEFDRNHMLKALAHGIDAHPAALSTIQSFGDDPSQYVLKTVRDILSKHGIPTDEFEQKIANAKAVAKAAQKKRLAERDARTFLKL